MADDDRIFDKLEGLERKIDDLRTKVETLNGTSHAHTAWIATHNELSTGQLRQMETLTKASALQHDYQQRQSGGLSAAKPLMIALWVMSVALVGSVGAYVGHVLK